MNIVVIPDAPVKKESKLLIQQANAGFTNSLVDLSAYVSEQMLENREKIMDKTPDHPLLPVAFDSRKMKDSISLYKKQCEKLSFSHTIGRAPTLPRDTKREDLDFQLYMLTVESIRICSELNCKYIIIEPIIKNVFSAEDRERNKEFYLSFVEVARESHIQILIRNQAQLHNGLFMRGLFSDKKQLLSFVQELNIEANTNLFGVCLDVGSCNICKQNPYEFMLGMNEMVKAVIIRENNARTDDSLLPFSSATNNSSEMDWLNIIKGLRAIDFDGELIYDFRTTQNALSHLLREDLILHAKKIIDFLVWQIEMERTIRKYNSRVLFGAGNMCRNYMKCYGEQYAPLYTCDNNQKIWGTTFEGLEIKPPYVLLELPPECAIFICNMYYDEIEAQLREMGITNPIERYNDEYLPSQYTDRFDSETREVR